MVEQRVDGNGVDERSGGRCKSTSMRVCLNAVLLRCMSEI